MKAFSFYLTEEQIASLAEVARAIEDRPIGAKYMVVANLDMPEIDIDDVEGHDDEGNPIDINGDPLPADIGSIAINPRVRGVVLIGEDAVRAHTLLTECVKTALDLEPRHD